MKRRNFLSAFGALFAIPLLSKSEAAVQFSSSRSEAKIGGAKIDDFVETVSTWGDTWTIICWFKPSKSSATIYTAHICGKRTDGIDLGAFKLEGVATLEGERGFVYNTQFTNSPYNTRVNFENGIFCFEVKGQKDHAVNWVCNLKTTTVY